MHAFTAIVTIALAAFATAQAPPPQGPPPPGEPCPPQFKLQCCQHVISAQDASLFSITIDPRANPGLASTGCADLAPTGQCDIQNYPVCCKTVAQGYSAGCIPA